MRFCMLTQIAGTDILLYIIFYLNLMILAPQERRRLIDAKVACKRIIMIPL